jgi:hypothetical protein
MDTRDTHRSRLATAGLLPAIALILAGCGGGPETGQVVEDHPEQAKGHEASQEEMRRLMQEGAMQ